MVVTLVLGLTLGLSVSRPPLWTPPWNGRAWQRRGVPKPEERRPALAAIAKQLNAPAPWLAPLP